jgi:hypothetical protein
MMFQRYLTRRILRMGACGAAIWLFAAPGMSEADKTSDKTGEKPAKMDKKACGGALKNAKEAQQANHLREAQTLLMSCVKATCSAFVKQGCLTRYNQLENDIPTIVPVVTDEGGVAVVDVQVKVDGELVTSKLDGRAFPIDPGNHEVTFANESGSVFATEKLMILQGQRNRSVAVAIHTGKHPPKSTLAAQVTIPPATHVNPEAKPTPEKSGPENAPPPKLVAEKSQPAEEQPESAPPQHHGGPGALPFVLGGIGLASVGAGVLFNVWGNNDNDALSQCTPDCSHESVKHVKTLYSLADISFGVGIASLGVATYLFATAGSSTKEKPPTKTAYSVDVRPTNGGAFATVSGAF